MYIRAGRGTRFPARKGSLPVLVFFLFFPLQEIVFILIVFLGLFNRLDFQRIQTGHLQFGPALVTTDGIAFFYFIFFDFETTVANRTLHHQIIPPEILLYDTNAQNKGPPGVLSIEDESFPAMHTLYK